MRRALSGRGVLGEGELAVVDCSNASRRLRRAIDSSHETLPHSYRGLAWLRSSARTREPLTRNVLLRAFARALQLVV